jgi:hypothetical protein
MNPDRLKPFSPAKPGQAVQFQHRNPRPAGQCRGCLDFYRTKPIQPVSQGSKTRLPPEFPYFFNSSSAAAVIAFTPVSMLLRGTGQNSAE